MRDDRGSDIELVPPLRGLCDSCAHQRLVSTTRGSVFSLCRRSVEDSSYPRYPGLPVTRCPGHQPRATESVAPAP